ncbi:HAD family hydrolase [Chitinophaga agrisoli]|uniref:D,D-heptose 1,7-bisphosphate phosphatase n=1 Tax=Chitinophaga agrisoli TaxID=2607653 RepID=A0A5B2VVX4_9BACT|nr:HAD family hydrolase [Chitinophaga agrisoli]KAA2242894.1 HAD family hydrolase [Chitinophaga agrisoli]
MKKAVFIDKDGTLIKDVPYNADPLKIELETGAIEALQQLQARGYALIVVSNQSGIAHGYFDDVAMEAVIAHITSMLRWRGVQLDGFFYCPHHPEGVINEYAIHCSCRKPMPGMLLQAAREMDLNLEQSWMIGDILHDVEAGNRAGCRTVLLDNGHETEWLINPYRKPSFVADDLLAAAALILKNEALIMYN